MFNNKKLLVFDLETDAINVDEANIVELSAIIIDNIKLTPISGTEFNILIKPEEMDSAGYIDKHKDTIEFHAKNKRCSVDDIVNKWKAATPEQQAWDMFVKYCENHHTKQVGKSKFTAPIPCGYNIINYDIPIIKRYIKKYKTKYLFSEINKVDIYDTVWSWFEGSDELNSLSLDSIREYFGISKDGAHTAKKDVEDTAQIICRFLSLHRRQFPSIRFKDSFK